MAETTDTTLDKQVVAAPEVSTEAKEQKVSDAPAAPDAQTSAGEVKLSSNAEAPAEPASSSIAPESSEKPAEAAEASQDVEMKDASAENETAAAAPNGTPSTPVATKKGSTNGSSKKKSAGVPEHKTKKLNRKKSKPDLHLECKPGDLYLARMKGHPAWPSVICDEAMLPIQLLNSRPVTTALPDGTFKKPEYAEGGKRAHERTFPIMFLYTNEFAWIPNTDLTPITPEECKDVPEKGKGKALLGAYEVAAKNHDLDHWKKMLAEHQKAINEESERKAERDVKKAEKADRARRKSEVADDDMDIDEDEEEPKPKSKKRKKSMDADEDDEKPAKTPKTAQKLKLNAPKTPTSESAKKKTPAKSKSAKKQSAKNASDEDVADTPVVEEKPLTPAEAKEKKEKEIRYYRHKLQKGFLSRDDAPGDEEINSMSAYLSKLEGYPDLEGGIIRATKIHKVLKAMIRLNSIPKDDEFNFKKRSMDLLTKWNKILAEDAASAGEGAGDKDDDKADDKADEKAEDKPATTEDKKSEDEKAEPNGVPADTEPQAAGALADEDKADTSNKIGTGVEGEKEAEKPAETTVEASDKTDAPNTEDAPAAEYKPPTEAAETAEATA